MDRKRRPRLSKAEPKVALVMNTPRPGAMLEVDDNAPSAREERPARFRRAC
jgi:hypothetical protein